ncbi:MAG: hypothetical protein ACE5IL_04765, partial [Myxococcota bacterium]
MKRSRVGLLGLLLGACVHGAPAIPPAESPSQASAPVLEPPSIAPRSLSRPDTRPRSAAIRLLSRGRYTLNVQDEDLAALLLGLGKDLPLNVVVGPGVHGTVSADLEGVSMLEILDQIVIPRGYYYRVEGRTLTVYSIDRATRVYRIDYPATARTGEAELSVRGAVAQDINTGGNQSQSEDVSESNVTTDYKANLWEEVEAGVRLIVFGNERGGTADSEEETADPEEASEAERPPGPDTPSRSVLVSRQSGLIIVTASGEMLDRVDHYLAEVKRSLSRQVLIDARIIEVALSDELDLGVSWEFSPGFGDRAIAGTVTRSITGGLAREGAVASQALAPGLTAGGFMFGIASNEVGAMINALAKQTDLRVIATPQLATLNNHKALIKVIRNEVFFVSDVEVNAFSQVGQSAVPNFDPTITPVGVTLDVTPFISEDGEITLHLHPSVSEIVSIVTQPKALDSLPDSGSLPVVDLREADTLLRVRDGQSVVIGGLRQERELDIEKKVPLLGDIPWLGQLFRGSRVETRRTELVIFVTPHLLDAPTIERVREDRENALHALGA